MAHSIETSITLPFRQRISAWATTVALSLLLAGGLATGPALASDEDALVVYKDQAKVFRLSQPASTIIVGNPAMLVATVQDLRTIVLTGKAFGTTNMIVLDETGQPILDETIVISANGHSKVYVYSRSDVTALSCSTGACYAVENTDE
ncbi:MAG: pilus assembly protein N-terminal domain-containing protein [Pseudomonadota bacterium]